MSIALFDLDDTLYHHSTAISGALDARMTAFISRELQIDMAATRALRRDYLRRYGTSVAGLVAEHGIDAEWYLREIHDLPFDDLLMADPQLDVLLGQLRARKAIFTNAPREHAENVLRVLGIAHHFEAIYDIRFAKFLPKPNLAYYHAVLAALDARAEDATFVEDNVQNLVAARELGMRTILIGDSPHPAADAVFPDVYAAIRHLIAQEDGA
jgi:putative hydrolase of the HAD superfamily